MSKRDVTPEDFQQLLNWLGPDPKGQARNTNPFAAD